MVRFSLVLCIGLLVDNAIIVVENVYHHYQLGKERLVAVIDGVSEIAAPVVSATLTTMAAFLPILLMTGTTGEYMGFLPKTVSIALSASLIVSLVANPLLLSRFMKRSVKDGRIVRPEEDLAFFKKIYVRMVSWALNHRFVIVVLTLLSMSGAISLVGLNVVKVEMFPDIDFDYIYIPIETPTGTDVELTNRIARQVENNDPGLANPSLRWWHLGAARFDIPVNTWTIDDFCRKKTEYKYSSNFCSEFEKQGQKIPDAG